MQSGFRFGVGDSGHQHEGPFRSGGEHPGEHRVGAGGGGLPGLPLTGDGAEVDNADRKSTRLNSSHANISYAVFCLKKKKKKQPTPNRRCSPEYQTVTPSIPKTRPPEVSSRSSTGRPRNNHPLIIHTNISTVHIPIS